MTKLEKVINGLEQHISKGCMSERELLQPVICPYFNNPHCIIALWRDALELLKARQWISVKDRLPEAGVFVLTASKTEYESYHMVDCIVNGDWWLQAGEEVLPVTHWMPLPEPPKEEKTE